MKVIICEDEEYWRDILEQAVLKWTNLNQIELECCTFSSPQGLVFYLEKSNDADVLFLDIALGEEVIDGIEVAKLIRKMNLATPIIFVTSNTFRAADGYLVEATGYLQKPIDEKRLALFLDRIYKRSKPQKTIKIVDDGNVTNIYQKDVVYVEISDHTVIYHTTQRPISHRGTLSEVLENLKDDNFVQVHRSFVIALDKIDSIKTTYPYKVNMRINNETVRLSVSRKYIENLLEAYSDDLVEKMI